MGNYKWTGLLLGAVALLLRGVAARFPAHTEAIYSRTFFPMIRQSIDATVGKLPFPTVYLFAAVVVWVLVLFFFRHVRKEGWQSKLRHLVRSMLNFVGFLVFFFLLLWGYNYQRVPVYQQLSIEAELLSPDQLLDELHLTHELLAQLRKQLSSDTLAIAHTVAYPELEATVRAEMKKTLPELGLDAKGQPRTKEFYPPGFMKKMGILGIYFPYTGESYIDPELHVLEKPFTVAHEMAHSFGITDEGEANFISWVVGVQSEDFLLQYAAHLQLLRYQLREMSRRDPEMYKEVVLNLDPGVKNDIISILLKARQTPPVFGELSRKSNDLYLKTQGVKAGVRSYAQLPALAYAWRKNTTSKWNRDPSLP